MALMFFQMPQPEALETNAPLLRLTSAHSSLNISHSSVLSPFILTTIAESPSYPPFLPGFLPLRKSEFYKLHF